MPDRSAVYIGTAFAAGVGLALICKDVMSSKSRHDKSTSSKHGSDQLNARPGPPAIVEGIEGCIGNTPLFRIKSLSDATGCEILGKAEVGNLPAMRRRFLTWPFIVFERRWSELKRPCSAEHD